MVKKISNKTASRQTPSPSASAASPRFAKITIFLLRIALGWLFLYSGITKIMNPEFTSAGFLGTAKTFSTFYQWFASAENIGWVDILNSWGQALIGLSLITGTFVRLSSFFGAILMLLYYFPGLDFPTVKNGFIIDDHIIYIFIFAIFITSRAGQFWGLDYFVNKKVKNWLV